MVWMTSKDFQNSFLTNERDKDILNSQYVICSLRIRKRKELDNIISAQSILFPGPDVCCALDDEDLRDRYMNQLRSAKAFLAALIKGSIEEGYNIVLMCSKNENKMKFLKYLSEFAYIEFGYPIYNYKKFADGITPIIKYKKKEVLKICNKILSDVKEKEYQKNLRTEAGRKKIIKDYKKMKKSDLKKKLKKMDLYVKGMTKDDMLDMLDAFM